MRRCGVCFVVVHGRVKAGSPGVPSRSGYSRRLDLPAAFSACEDQGSASWICSSPENWPSSALGVTSFDNIGEPCLIISCLLAMLNCRNPEASLLYLVSSINRQGAEMCTRISMGGVMVLLLLHVEKNSLLQVSGASVWMLWIQC